MPGKVEAPGRDEGADQGTRPEHDQRKFDAPGGRIEGSATLGPDVEQVTAGDCLERATGRGTQGRQHRVRSGRIGSAAQHPAGKRGGKNRWPKATAAQENGQQGKTAWGADRDVA